MTTPGTPATRTAPGPPAAIIDGINVDVVAAAVRACSAIEDLHAGSPGEIATYLPGRRVVGVQIAPDAVLIQVRSRWGVPAEDVAAQIRDAVADLARRRVDVVIGDVGDPPSARTAVTPSSRQVS